MELLGTLPPMEKPHNETIQRLKRAIADSIYSATSMYQVIDLFEDFTTELEDKAVISDDKNLEDIRQLQAILKLNHYGLVKK